MQKQGTLISKGDKVYVLSADDLLLWIETVVKVRGAYIAITDKGTMLRREMTLDGYYVSNETSLRYYPDNDDTMKRIAVATMKIKFEDMMERIKEREFTIEEMYDFYDRNKKFL